MTFTGAVGIAVFHAVTDFVSIRGSMGMDTGAIAGESDAVPWNEPVPQGRDEGGKAEKLLEPFFIMEGEFFLCQGIIGHEVRNPGMLIGEFFSFSRLLGRF